MVSKKSKKIFFFFLLFLIWKIRHGIGEKRWLFSIGKGAEIWPLEIGRKSPVLGLCPVWPRQFTDTSMKLDMKASDTISLKPNMYRYFHGNWREITMGKQSFFPFQKPLLRSIFTSWVKKPVKNYLVMRYGSP